MARFKEMLEYAKTHKDKGQNPEFYKDDFEKHFEDNIVPNDFSELNNDIIAAIGNTPITIPDEQWPERQVIHESAKNNMFQFLSQITASNNLDKKFDLQSRNGSTLLYFDKSPEENNTKNKEIIRILKSGTPEEQRTLFHETMKRMTDVDMENLVSASDKYLADNVQKYMPALMLGAEAEKLLPLFKSLNFYMTEDEEKQFQTLSRAMLDASMAVRNRLDTILSPLYKGTDLQAFNNLSGSNKVKFLRVMDDYHGNNPDFADLEDMTTSLQSTLQNDLSTQMLEILGLDNKKAGDVMISPVPSRTRQASPSEPDINFTLMDAYDALKAGKTLFVFDEKDPKGPIKAVRDFKGNGLLTEIPMAVKKPGNLAFFGDAVLRFFGIKTGLKSCHEYRMYEQAMHDAEASAEHQLRFPGFDSVKKQFTKPAKEMAADSENSMKKTFSEKFKYFSTKLNKIQKGLDNSKSKFIIEKNQIERSQKGPEEMGADFTKMFHNALDQVKNAQKNPTFKWEKLNICKSVMSYVADSPEIKNHFKITREEKEEYLGRVIDMDAQVKALEASAALTKAASKGAELPAKQKEKAILDMAMHEMINYLRSHSEKKDSSKYADLNQVDLKEIRNAMKQSPFIQDLTKTSTEKLGVIASFKSEGEKFKDDMKNVCADVHKQISEHHHAMGRARSFTEPEANAEKKEGAMEQHPVPQTRPRSRSLSMPNRLSL